MSGVRTLALAAAVAGAAMGSAGCAGPACDRPATQAPATTTSASATEANKAFVRAYVDDVWGKRNLDAIEKYVAADLVNHAAIPQAQGAAGMRTIASKLLTAFPDLNMKITQVAAEGDDVIVRVVFEGTHTGPLAFTKMPLEATGKHVSFDQVHTFRVSGGRIVEAWLVMDRAELMGQLGVRPGGPPPSAGAPNDAK